MKGRKPKPTALKELAGNPGHRPLNKLEPKPEGALPDCPKELRGPEKLAWRVVADEMKSVLTAADQFVLVAFCVAWGQMLEALRDIRKHGVLVPMPVQAGDDKNQLALNLALAGSKQELPPAMRVQNPAQSILKNSMLMVQKLAGDLGLTPSARARLKAESEAPDDAEDFLFGDRSAENEPETAENGERVQ